jgi:hypothetical protein
MVIEHLPNSEGKFKKCHISHGGGEFSEMVSAGDENDRFDRR